MAYFHPDAMQQYKIFKGDCILVKSSFNRTTLLICLTDINLPKDAIKINNTVCKNLQVTKGCTVHLKPAGDVSNVQRINVVPFADTLTGDEENIW